MDLLAGTMAPHVPYLPARDAADRGPAGSLVQARSRQRLLRRSERRRARADWRVWVAAGLAVLALLLLAGGGGGVVLGILLSAGALGVASRRWRPDAVEDELTRQWPPVAGDRTPSRTS